MREKKNQTNIVLIILMALLLGVIFLILKKPTWLGFIPKIEKPEYWENPNFRTDTVQVEHHYHTVQQPIYNTTVPPAVVFEYPDLLSQGITLELLDSVLRVNDSLKNQITLINREYLANYPRAHKLINSYFKQDTISFDFLAIDGKIRTEIYPVNYSRFNYQYYNNQLLTNTRSPTSGQSNLLNLGLFGFGGYDVVNKVPILSGTGLLGYKNYQLMIDNRVLLRPLNYQLEIRLGYKIK